MPGDGGIEMIRPQRIARNVVFIDGMAHSGKQIIAQLLSTADRGELALFNQNYENICIAHRLGKLSGDAAGAFINHNADIDLYNLMISRNTNLRKADETSADFSFMHDRHMRRAEMKDGDAVVDRIKQRRPVLFYMTHHLFGASDILFRTLERRLSLFLVAVRHPLWLVDLWCQKKWRTRIGQQPREFQLCCRRGRKIMPWYAAMWLPGYNGLRPLEQAIRLTQVFFDGYGNQLRSLAGRDKKKVHFVPFEPCVSDPWAFFDRFAGILRLRRTALTKKMMGRFSMPRPRLTTGELDAQRLRVDRLMNVEKTPAYARKILDRLCQEYESKYLSEFELGKKRNKR